ncbi:MAG TPA: hypothetical protein ENI27_08340 [bacterium]|nr:hypothetical protein [bacterium]
MVDINQLIREEQSRSLAKHGRFNSAHELYAVLKEEVDEFWDSVKADNPDPLELVQIAAVARRGYQEIMQTRRKI